MKKSDLKEFFLPDFCRVQSVLMVVLIGELLAVIFTLLTAKRGVDTWQSLGLYSISMQWVLLMSVGTLCILRPFLARLKDLYAGVVSLLIILTATSIFTTISILYYYGLDFNPFELLQRQFFTKNMIIAGLIGAVMLRYFYLQQQYRKQLTLETSARLEALQARIRPHFLFNSMNVIASLTRIDPKTAETAIEDLSDLIRATLDNRNELIPLEIELENGKRYLSIETLRLGERLQVDWQVDERCLGLLVPPLSVQPLLENAVYHGIQMLPDGGTIKVKVGQQGKMLNIEVNNPKMEESEHKGNGIALNNISQRLEVIFQGQASLERTNTNNLYTVIMKVPTDLSYRQEN